MDNVAAIAAKLSPAQVTAVLMLHKHGFALGTATREPRHWSVHKLTARALEGLGVADVKRHMSVIETWGMFGRGNLHRRHVCEYGTALTALGVQVAEHLSNVNPAGLSVLGGLCA